MSDLVIRAYETRIRPLTALKSLYRILSCKEATHEVFKMVAALDGPVGERNFKRFAASDFGQKVLREKRDIVETLKDRETLAALPVGTFGREYYEFVTREDISPEEFEREMQSSGEKFTRAGEDRRRFIHRFRHAHDLLHVLTGYGRDFIGEASVIAFTCQHNHSRAFRLLIAFGIIKGWCEYPGLPILDCTREGGKLGRASVDLLFADWEALLPLPLSEVRRQLKVGIPKRYLGIKTGAELIDRRYREEIALATG